MGYKAYYTFKTTAEKDIDEINFDWVNLGSYRFDVYEADGFRWEGKEVNCAGSFRFSCEKFNEDEDDYFEEELDWDNIDEDLNDLEATFSLFDEEGEPVDFGNENESEFELSIYDKDGNEHAGKSKVVFAGNM